MELNLIRDTFTDKSTIGKLYVDNKFECYMLEDTDRGLDSKMNLDILNHLKKFGVTAIPYGRYEITITKSERFSMLRGKPTFLPLLNDTPGYGGVRIHTGNRPEDTEGCILPCTKVSKDLGIDSTTSFNNLFKKISDSIKKNEKVFITISKH